jgi:hypothetical protein
MLAGFVKLRCHFNASSCMNSAHCSVLREVRMDAKQMSDAGWAGHHLCSSLCNGAEDCAVAEEHRDTSV